MASKSKNLSSPFTLAMIFLCSHIVHPSFNQKCSHVALVTKFPVQECAISCATTSARERSPARRVGVTKVRQGFSMPP